MQLQTDISTDKLRRKIGRTLTVLVDAIDGEQAIARSSADAPDIDGLVYIENGSELAIGELATVTVVASDEHDLSAVLNVTDWLHTLLQNRSRAR